MTADQLHQVDELFDALYLLPQEQWQTELLRLCPDDLDVRSHVTKLLTKPVGSNGLDISAKLQMGRKNLRAACNEMLQPGSEFEGYKIEELLGEGGYGSVFRAVERGDINRVVAIKIIHPDIATPGNLARFELEGQILADLRHPNIAEIYQAERSENNLPYFVMEYVPGSPITKFADENKLSIPDRLELFLQLCDAVIHTHKNAVIHRDIKAANVIAFRSRDGKNTVKLVDFGIAKSLTGASLKIQSFITTRRGDFLASYDGVSPEQAAGRPDIDTLTDVYSLGSLLYELLVGVKPFDIERLKALGDIEARRAIVDESPPPPSKRLTMQGDFGVEKAAARGTTLPGLVRTLQAELERIPQKAMRKERTKDARYQSVSELSNDIRNYLANKPISALPDSIAYKSKKWLRRNRVPAISGVALILLTILFVAIYIRGIRIEHAKTELEQIKTLMALEDLKGQTERTDAERKRTAELRGSSAAALSKMAIAFHEKDDSQNARDAVSAAYTLWGDVDRDIESGLRVALTPEEEDLHDKAGDLFLRLHPEYKMALRYYLLRGTTIHTTTMPKMYDESK